MRLLTVLCIIFLSVTASSPARAELKVLTSFTVFADMASRVAGDRAEVVSITRPGAEIHQFRPTPGDIRRGLGADLALWNGLGLETWFERYLENLGDVPAVILSEGVDPIDIGEGPYAGRPNPHAWMSPASAAIYVDNIVKALSAADPANADYFKANGEAYKKEISAVFEPVVAAIEALPEERRWLVSSEGAFPYLARDLGLRSASIWAINADSQGSPQQVRQIIDLVRAHNIPAIFSESTVSSKPAEQVARETGARYGGVLYVDSLSETDGPVPTYLDLLRVTSETIVAGLRGDPA